MLQTSGAIVACGLKYFKLRQTPLLYRFDTDAPQEPSRSELEFTEFEVPRRWMYHKVSAYGTRNSQERCVPGPSTMFCKVSELGICEMLSSVGYRLSKVPGRVRGFARTTCDADPSLAQVEASSRPESLRIAKCFFGSLYASFNRLHYHKRTFRRR